MKFSIIMPVFLGHYKGAATDRKNKFTRAVASVLQQTLSDWELIIVSDGCEDSRSFNFEDNRIRQFLIQKQKYLSGAVRNEGIAQAQGENILYLDSDDYWGPDHLKIIDAGLYKAGYPEWAHFNDWIAQKDGKFVERICNIHRQNQNGTSNVVHKRGLKVQWTDGYLHDWHFIQQLKRYRSERIATPEYLTCHIPNQIDI